MADEEKDEQVIVIEDLEEEEEGEELKDEGAPEEEPGGEKEAERPAAEGAQEATISPRSPKKSLIFALLGGVVFLSVIVIAYFVFFKKPQKPQKVAHPAAKLVHRKVKKVRVEKQKVKHIAKKKKAPAKYNPTVDVHFIQAMRLQATGNYRAAINELKQASLDLYLSYYNIGYLYLKMGMVKKAKEYLLDKTEEYLKLTIENNPDFIDAYVNLFKVYMAKGEYGKAQKIIDLLEHKNVPVEELETMKAYYGFVVSRNRKGVEELLQRYPDSPLLNSLEGEVLLTEGRISKALEHFKKALKTYQMGSVYYNTMLADVEAGHYSKALNSINKTTYMDFSRINCRDFLSFYLLFKAYKFTAAHDYLLRALKQDNATCFSHFRIVPISVSRLSTKDLVVRRNVPYMLAAEIMNMYLRPIKFVLKGAVSGIKLGKLYERLGLPARAFKSYASTANFAQAMLLSERAVALYLKGKYADALAYYKEASKRLGESDPIVLYNIAIMYLKLHKLNKAMPIIERLNNAYPDFPLPYLLLFIAQQLSGKHENAIQQLGNFVIKANSVKGANRELKGLSIIADFVANNRVGNVASLSIEQRRLFLVIRAALNDDLDYIRLESAFLKSFGLAIDATNNLSIIKYFARYYPTDFIRRTLSDYYLIEKDYEDAYRALFGIPVYTAVDYYKFGIAYLLDGYPEVADNFFTKSILKSAGMYDGYVAKVILQAAKGDLKGIEYYLKIILKRERAWFNSDVYLSYKITFK